MTGQPAPGAAERPSLLSPFGHHLFLAVWLSNTVSNFGFQIQTVGAAWAMTVMTGSPKLVALVVTAQLLPMVLFSLLFGAVADVFDRRHVMLAAQLIRVAAATALAVIAYLGFLSPALLLLLTFVLGCGLALNSPAAQAVVGDLVPHAEIAGAVTLNSMGFNIARTLAPAIGGLVVATSGSEAAFLLNALSYIALLIVLLRWNGPERTSSVAREGVWSAAVGGLKYVTNAQGVGRIVVRAAFSGTALAALTALLPLLVKDRLHADSALYGILLGCAGVGAVTGGISRLWLRARLSSEALLQLAQTAIAVALLICSLSRSPVLTGAALILYGAGMFLSLNSFTVTMQMSVPRWVTGRAMAVVSMGNMGGFAFGAWLWGSLAEVTDVATSQQCAAGLLLLAMLLGLRFPLGEPDPELYRPVSRQLPSRFTFAEHDGRLPVTVVREFRIEAGDRETFLRLMAERRRLRKGQGARRWTLAQDLEKPELWVERYHLPNSDHLQRTAERTTVEEQRNLDKIKALARGDTPKIRILVERGIEAAASPVVRPEEEF